MSPSDATAGATTDSVSTPLRIVMVAHSHLLGGMERHVLVLMQALQALGHVVAFAGPADGWLGEQVAAAGIEQCHVPMHGMYDPISAFKLRRFLRRFDADIVHGHSQRGARYAAWSGRLARVAAVATAHSTNAYKWFAPDMHVLAVASAVREFLVGTGLAADHVHTVYSGVPDLALDGAKQPTRDPDTPLALGMVARLEPVKGQDIAVQALARLSDLPLQLRLIGSTETAFAAQVRSLADELDQRDRVVFLGQRSDIAEQLAQLDLLLAPSRREALSLTLMEACSASLPIVASRIGGNPEAVVDGENGLLVPAEDPQALADAIRRLAADPALRERMQRCARRRYDEQFTLPAMARNTVAVYRRALAHPPSRSPS